MYRTAVFSLCLLSAPAFAEDTAEHRDISQDMAKLAERNQWEAVDRRFDDLAKLEPTASDYLLGAQAARNIGDAETAFARYAAAGDLEPSDDVTSALDDYLAHWATVDLIAKGGAPGLAPDVRPFQPDRASAIDFAAASVGEDGTFSGMLPHGKYTLSTAPFELTADESKYKINHKGVTVDDALAETLKDIPKAPTAAQSKSTPFFGGAAGSAVIGGVALALAAGASAKYHSDTILVTELDAARSQANLWSMISIGAGGAAVGLGVVGVVVK